MTVINLFKQAGLATVAGKVLVTGLAGIPTQSTHRQSHDPNLSLPRSPLDGENEDAYGQNHAAHFGFGTSYRSGLLS